MPLNWRRGPVHDAATRDRCFHRTGRRSRMPVRFGIAPTLRFATSPPSPVGVWRANFGFRNLEARAGIEPADRGFADPGLTTWLPRPEKSNREGSMQVRVLQVQSWNPFRPHLTFRKAQLDARLRQQQSSKCAKFRRRIDACKCQELHSAWQTPNCRPEAQSLRSLSSNACQRIRKERITRTPAP